MNEERKEYLITALQIIRDLCKAKFDSKSSCDNCPLHHIEKDECYLMNVLPKNWNIKGNAKDDWRAFYD